MRYRGIHFSPTGGTRRVVTKVVTKLVEELGGGQELVDLLADREIGEIAFTGEEVMVIGVPVFAGRVPPACAEKLGRLRGENTPAIVCVVYGNRAYEDALVELRDIVENRGFRVVAGAAFIAQHSVFPAVAADRPDGADAARMGEFARECARKLENGAEEAGAFKGNRPYRQAGGVPLAPSVGAACTRCGACARICPAGAIDAATPDRTDATRCIACAACIAHCPARARKFSGLKYRIAGFMFGRKYSTRLEPEIFL